MHSAAWQTLSKAVHWLLLIGIAILIVTGPLSLWSVGRPFGIYDWLSFPSPLPEFRALHKPLENIHGLTSKIMLLMIGLHLAGVLKHVVIDATAACGACWGALDNKCRPTFLFYKNMGVWDKTSEYPHVFIGL